MPHAERPSSPDEPSSDQYYIYRLEQDLYELFEEQQLLLDIVAQQQERLEHQLEVQRLLTSEPPVRRATPVPELVPVPSDEVNIEMDVEPEPVVAVPDLLAIEEADELAVHTKELVGQGPELVIVPESVPELEIDLFEAAEQRPSTPATPELELELELASQTNTPPELEQPTWHGNEQMIMPYVHDINAGKCTPPKRSGLGYDLPFPYPRRMDKSRDRRALYIFTLVADMVMQLQRFMSLVEMGLDGVYIVEVEVASHESPLPVTAAVPVTAVLSATTGALPKIKPKSQYLWKPKSKFHSHSKSSDLDMTVKRSHIKPVKRLHKQAILTAIQLDLEIDLDCEFGMDHIKKFRTDRVREDEEARLRDMSPNENQRQMVHMKLNSEVDNSESEEPDGEQLAEALASLVISEDNNQTPRKPKSTSWLDQIQMFAGCSQVETRACTPNTGSYPLLPGVLHADSYINPLPSTSAQAQSLSMSSTMPTSPLFLTSSSPPIARQLPEYVKDSQMSFTDHFAKVTTKDYKKASGDFAANESIFDNGQNNANTSPDGYQILCAHPACPAGAVQSSLQSAPSAPAPMYNNNGIQSPMDTGEDDYARL